MRPVMVSLLEFPANWPTNFSKPDLAVVNYLAIYACIFS